MNDEAASHVENNHPSQEFELEKPSSHRFHKFGCKHPVFFYKTPLCKHDHGCIENALVDTINSFLYGYGIRAIIALIGFAMREKNKNPM